MFSVEVKPPIEFDALPVGDKHVVLLPYIKNTITLEKISEENSTSDMMDTLFIPDRISCFLTAHGNTLAFNQLLGRMKITECLQIFTQESKNSSTYQRPLFSIDLFPPSLTHLETSSLVRLEIDEISMCKRREEAEANNYLLQSLAVQMSNVIYFATKACPELISEMDMKHIEMIKKEYQVNQKFIVLIHEVQSMDNIRPLAQKLALKVEEQPLTILFKNEQQSGDVLLLRSSSKFLHFFIVEAQDEQSSSYNQRTLSYMKNNLPHLFNSNNQETCFRSLLSQYLQNYVKALVYDEMVVGPIPIYMYEWNHVGCYIQIPIDSKVQLKKKRYRANFPQSLSFVCGGNNPSFLRNLKALPLTNSGDDSEDNLIVLVMHLHGHSVENITKQKKTIKITTKIDSEALKNLQDAREQVLCSDHMGNKELSEEISYSLPHSEYEIVEKIVDKGMLKVTLREMEE